MNAKNDEKKYIVYGVFDLFHAGHANLLYRASQRGKVYVAIFSDEDVLESKGKKPFFPEELRVKNIECLDFVEGVILIEKGKHSDIWNFAKKNNIKYGLLGDDHKDKAVNWFKSNGIELEITNRTNGISSTFIKEIINSLENK